MHAKALENLSPKELEKEVEAGAPNKKEIINEKSEDASNSDNSSEQSPSESEDKSETQTPENKTGEEK